MTMNITGRNVHETLPRVMTYLLAEGTRDASRNGDAREYLAATIQLEQPWERFAVVPGRNGSPASMIAETMWVLHGRNDIDWLSYYLPRAAQYSDDNGRSWRAGYGPRLRWYPGKFSSINVYIDQVSEIVQMLYNDPNTRRAVASIWNATEDLGTVSKDIPCNDMLQFLVRDNRLHMHVHVRSNDVVWGWSGINAFEWSMLHELVANSLGLQQGPITYFIGSLHLYDAHAQRAQQIAQAKTMYTHPYHNFAPTRFTYTYRNLDQLGNDFFRCEERIRTDPSHINKGMHAPANDPWLRALDIYCRVTEGDADDDVIEERMHILSQWSDVHWAMQDWLQRKRHASVGSVTLTIEPGSSANPLPLLPATPEQNPLDTLEDSVILQTLSDLEDAKSKTYGTSWCKYGELASIFPNVARKYDRLTNIWNKDTSAMEETLVDTLADLAVYCMKYYSWLKNPDIKFGMSPAIRDLVNTPPATMEHDNIERFLAVQYTFEQLEYALGFNHVYDTRTLVDTHGKSWTVLKIAKICLEWLEDLYQNDAYAGWARFAAMVDRLKLESCNAVTSGPAVH